MKTRGDERHGMSRAPEYKAWSAMIARCHRPWHPNYPTYGERGIVVCPQWRVSFSAFFAEIGPRPTPRHQVDRVDNSRSYEPGNVRWATPAEQMRNTRRTRMVTAHGRTMCVEDWANETGIRKTTLTQRLNMGWPDERAVTEPPAAAPNWRKMRGAR